MRRVSLPRAGRWCWRRPAAILRPAPPKRWPSCADSIGIRSTPTSAAADTTSTRPKTSPKSSSCGCCQELLARHRPPEGQIRAFLLASLKHFLANEWDRSQRKKRGGGQTILPISAADAENRYRSEPWHDLTPEKLFERRWALTVLDHALARLQTAPCLRGETSGLRAAEAVSHRRARRAITPRRPPTCKRPRGPSKRPSTASAAAIANCSATKSPRPSPAPRRSTRKFAISSRACKSERRRSGDRLPPQTPLPFGARLNSRTGLSLASPPLPISFSTVPRSNSRED